MPRLAVMCLGAILALGACGDDDPKPPPPPASIEEVVAQLAALPGVTATIEPTVTRDYTYAVIQFTQPVDHEAPSGPTFQQRVSLLFHDGAAPMIVHTGGYQDYTRDRRVELTRLLTANQVSIEHRYFGTSRPDEPAWDKLTIRQMADDQHAIIAALRGIFPGAFLSTGGSKGGMTAVYHRRFYPDDVEGTVPYVAPISFGAPDDRYNPFLDTIGTATCRQALRDLAIEMLANRRAQLLQRAQNQAATNGHTYTRVPIEVALEIAVEAFEFVFWQYAGVEDCDIIPTPTATDADLFGFLDAISPVSDSDDATTAEFDAYYYQAYAQLGFPEDTVPYLAPYTMYTEEDFLGALPAPKPAFDAAAMRDIDAYVQQRGERLLFVYGAWDPWTAGAFTLGAARDSLLVEVAEGTHAALLSELAPADREAAFAKLAAWTGVTPVPIATRTSAADLLDPILRMPPTHLRLR